MSTPQNDRTLEDRLRAVEDTFAIYHLIASHPPAADTGTDRYYRDAFMTDGVIDLGGGKTANGNEAIAAVVRTSEHQAAIAGGLCHFAGLPRVVLDGDRATARPRPRICRSSRRIVAPRQWKCPATAVRAAFAFTVSAPTAGSSSAPRTAGR